MQSQSFDGLVEIYDETRSFDKDCFDSALQYLGERFPPHMYPNVFEPGIGTGRIAIPLAERGYRVTGVDVSPEMLDLLAHRLRESGQAHVSHQLGDATALPFAGGLFDLAIAVHLFYFIPDWRKAADEMLRVVKVGNPLILMHTGMGMEVPALNSRYKELCAAHGYEIKPVGVAGTGEVLAYLESLGCRVEQIRDRWTWVSSISLDKAIGYLESRAYSFTAETPDAINVAAIETMRSELLDVSAHAEVPNQIALVVVTR
ncbi:MAG: class I SAM-dependent methyltransferase [Armatimonadetes bacterium]|nr:class I SAM-dependent methyltransferase [Armatimonadota bacterium]